MKNSNIFLVLILSLGSMFIIPSCDQSEHQINAQLDTTQQITNRTNCDCPVGYCCAAIELLDDVIITVQFCGVYTGTSGTPCGPYSPGSPCGTISGSTSSIQLDGSGDRAIFCVPIGGSFRIVGPAGGPYPVRITTEYDEVNPTWENIDLDTTPLYYDTNGNCELFEC